MEGFVNCTRPGLWNGAWTANRHQGRSRRSRIEPGREPPPSVAHLSPVRKSRRLGSIFGRSHHSRSANHEKANCCVYARWLRFGMFQEGGSPGNSEIGAQKCDSRRVESGAAPERQLVRFGCNSALSRIVNNLRTLMWDFWGALSHEVFCSPRRIHLNADLLSLQRFAERAVTPGGHAGRPEAWDKVRLFRRNSSVCTVV
jgi:hypothetical protein